MAAAAAFHLAFAVADLAAAKAFYVDLLGCEPGRQTQRWVDFNFWGHQLSAHLVEETCREEPSSLVDGDRVPTRHFGVILDWPGWEALRDRLRAAGASFILEPRVRFVGEPGEQATMFVADPSGNALEFKAYRRPAEIFRRNV